METTVLEYALKVGTNDVQATLRWLISRKFLLVDSIGGEGAGFGNIYLVFTGPALIRIVRDRGQWAVDVGPAPRGPLYDLDTLAAARSGSAMPPPKAQQADGGLPAQLPTGQSWLEQLPAAVDWLQQPKAPAADPRLRPPPA